jgi:hypothetical protein
MIRFESKAGSGFSMLENDAKQMLKLMQHSGTVPGAINADGLAAALNNLQTALREQPAEENPVKSHSPADADDHGQEPPVSMSTRAYPLIQLLQAAQEKQEAVMWDHDHSIL